MYVCSVSTVGSKRGVFHVSNTERSTPNADTPAATCADRTVYDNSQNVETDNSQISRENAVSLVSHNK